MIVTGFQGDTVSSPGFQEVLRDLEAGRIGGVLFLENNIRSKRHLLVMTAKLRRCRCAAPPLLMIDEEGGRVERLSAAVGFHNAASAREIGRQPDMAKSSFDAIAADVKAAGLNMNLGPVVDLDVNPASPVIGKLARSYSADPDRVASLARLFIERHRKAGVLTVLKHFPGHGSSRTDSHRGFADVTKTWSDAELMPYRLLISAGLADAVMAGHISSNSWSGPASLSPATAITGLLRDEMKYDGLVITDDLDMGAVRSNSPDFRKTIIRAAGAGSDVLVVSNFWSGRPGIGGEINLILRQAVETGNIQKRSVVTSYARIMRLKKKIPD